MQAMVLSIIGKDKSGLVEQLAKAVTQAEGNWLESSFCQLGGHFAGFVEIMLPKDNHNALIQHCHSLSNLQITLVPASANKLASKKITRLSVTGNDRLGIVSDIASALKSFDINIESLSTLCESAPNWGSPLFTATIKISADESFNTDSIIETLEEIADDLVVDVKV